MDYYQTNLFQFSEVQSLDLLLEALKSADSRTYFKFEDNRIIGRGNRLKKAIIEFSIYRNSFRDHEFNIVLTKDGNRYSKRVSDIQQCIDTYLNMISNINKF